MNQELFDFAVNNGIINLSELEALRKDMENAKYLDKHFGEGYKLTKGKDGRYATRLPNGKQVRKTDKIEFIQEIVNYYRRDNNDVTVKEVFDMWVNFKYDYEGIARGTYDRFMSDFKRFFTNNIYAVDIMRKRSIRDVDEDELEMFIRNTIKTYNLTSKGWQKLKTLVNGIWLYALKIKATNIYITKFIDMLSISPKVLQQRIESEEEQVFTDEEVKLILDEINKREFSVLNYGIVLCFYTGMRSGEIAALKWSDISPDFGTITVRHMEVFYKDPEHKGRTVHEVVDHAKTIAGLRKIIAPDALIPYLKKLKEVTGDCEYIFTHDNERVHATNFSDKLSKLCKQLNLPPRRMHKIRKTVCSKLCDSGVDERLMLRQIGHTNTRTTETYYHRDRRTDLEKREILNNVIAY